MCDSLMWSYSFLFPLLGGMVAAIIYFLPENYFYSVSMPLFMGELELSSVFLVDFLSISFLLVVSLVSFSVLVYSNEYMKEDFFKKKFIITMVIFIMSMMILSFSADLFWLMVGWDGLGLSSFYLISFFQNWKSFNSAMFTFISNRLGDCLILFSLSWVFCFMPQSWGSGEGIIFLVFGAFSKSAQFPFSAWLPMAMAAPTPVSSLVHSSTLVTAGVYLLIRFNSFVDEFNSVMFMFSLVTIVLAGTSSLMEMDIKKVIALSTLSHIGLMILFVSVGLLVGAMIHLMVHAMFKSLLFMISGVLIHSSDNFQDIRRVSLSSSFPDSVALIVSLMSMIGAPFLSGFISKEMMYSSIQSGSFFSLFMFFIAVLFTSSYSFRILVYLFKNSWSVGKESSFNSALFTFMGWFSVVGGSILKSSPNFQSEIKPFSFFNSSIILIVVLVVGCISSSFVLSNFFFLKKVLHEMWFIASMSTFFQKSLFMISWLNLFKSDSKGMLDSLFLEEAKNLSILSKSGIKILINPLLVVEMLSIILMIVLFLEFF